MRKGRLQPGRMFLVDTEQGRIIGDEEIKRAVATEHPYRAVAGRAPGAPEGPAGRRRSCRPRIPTRCCARQIAFGYTFEDQRMLLEPMARNGVEAVGSMGNDTPLAALSSRPRLLYDYFKQLFAQVTNPPIDCIREELITASEVWLGSEGNLLQPQPADCRRLELKGPILTNEEFAKVRRLAPAGPQGRDALDPVPRHPRREGTDQVGGGAVPCGAPHRSRTRRSTSSSSATAA